VGRRLMTMGRWQTDLELAPHEVAPGTAPGPASASSSIEPDGEPALGQSPVEVPLDPSGRRPGVPVAADDDAASKRLLGFGRFDYLIAQGCVTRDEVATAVRKARVSGGDVETILMEEYGVKKTDLGAALADFFQVPFVEFDSRTSIDPELVRDLKLDFLRKHTWVPLRRDAAGVLVLIDNPRDLRKVDSIRVLMPRDQVRFAVGLPGDILKFVARLVEADPGAGIAAILSDLRADHAVAAVDAPRLEVEANDSSVVRFANRMILDAWRKGVSDIHVEPRGAKKETLIRFRVDGDCFEYERVPSSIRAALVARLKIMAQLDIAERRKPQDGKIRVQVGDREVELRVATIPTAGGNEDMVLRLLAPNATFRLESLGMTDRNQTELRTIAGRPYGLILCVGPTGSGKTTTLHALLDFLNKPARKIWTAEDPVEITQEGLRQVQVQPKIGFTFAAALRAFLRADPDVIMVGEMRDQETAAIAIEASLTGHLVLSTLHTNSAPETIVRLLDLGVDPFTCADAMLGIIAQRLVKCLCAECKASYRPPREAYDDLAEAYGREEFERLGVQNDDQFVLWRGRGCAHCNNTGYRGRAGIHELLIASDEVKRLIQTRARAAEILARAKADGMTTLVQDGIVKSLQGITDLAQVRAVAIK
jgi:type II secretory ATPase GspE/PulE/Tfp pilus assembly ATPase PilB-like protein